MFSTHSSGRRILGIFVLLIVAVYILTAFSVSAETVEEKERRLRAELEQVEREIAAQQKILSAKKQETASIERDIAILTAQIKEAELVIRSKNIAIERLGKDINTKNQTIGELSEQIERGKDSLGQLIRKTNELDHFSSVEVMLSSQDLSDFFTDLDDFDSVKKSLQVLFSDIRDTRQTTEVERDALTQKQKEERDARAVIEQERAKIKAAEQERQYLLTISKTQERAYETILREREQKAAAIRAALFSLRDAAAIPFGEALEIAKEVQRKTGVRPAFMLAILTQESNLGQNVGTCNRPGDPPNKHWTQIMPGPNDGHRSYRDDQTIFKSLMERLGRSPEGTPLSCPWQGGWGGAMGPAQFIPTTWKSYEAKIAAALGKSVPDPWNPRDAFMASGIYLSELGAGAGTFSAEREAALRYYAGANWNKPQNAFYGNQVMIKADSIQQDINVLESL